MGTLIDIALNLQYGHFNSINSSKSIGYFSIYLYHIQFPSSMFCSFQNSDLSPPWLNLFLGILFFLMQLQMGIAFLTSLLDSSFLVCKNTIDCYSSVVYPATLFILTVLGQSLGFSLSCHLNMVTDLFPLFQCRHLLFVFCQIALSRNSINMLDKSSKNGHTFLIFDRRGIAFSFSLLSVMLPMGFLYMGFNMLRYFPYVGLP